jgi:hypothetical protein
VTGKNYVIAGLCARQAGRIPVLERIVMPDQFDSSSLSADRTGETESSSPSRRSVLRGAAGAGAAGLAVTALGGLVMPAASAVVNARSASAHDDEHTAGESIVVHVRDAASGHIDIFRGETAISVRDRDLAARIVRASR